MKKRFAAAGLAAGLTGGAIAGIALTHPSVSGAQTDTTTETTVPAQTDESESEATRPEPGAWLSETLAPLVADGTITQAQADAVIAAIQEARPDHGLRGHRFGRGVNLEIAATAIGISTEDLRTALQGGQSLAEVAQANGVDPQVVIDAFVADVKTHLDARVASGDLTQAEADEKFANATERITAMVNGDFPDRPFGPGPRGDDTDDTDDAGDTSPSSDTSASGASTS
jgi:hypothetical protein